MDSRCFNQICKVETSYYFLVDLEKYWGYLQKISSCFSKIIQYFPQFLDFQPVKKTLQMNPHVGCVLSSFVFITWFLYKCTKQLRYGLYGRKKSSGKAAMICTLFGVVHYKTLVHLLSFDITIGNCWHS